MRIPLKALVRNLCSSSLTMSCSILLMAHAIPGTLTFGKSSFSFNPKDTAEVSNYLDTSCVEKWWYADVTAVFLRLYLHQRRAAEVFFCNQMATFFDNFQALKQFVKRLELESCMEYLLQGQFP
ncbi:uncharacterized protein [Dysidea avara]|uniref:uncharacterized protein n=1 Tax=Dysidea avara TaxID=196820 RepID=UPI00331BDBDE